MHYRFESRSALVYIAEGNCVDMGGCIDFVKTIDPDVKAIDTMAVRAADNWPVRDTCYRKRRDDVDADAWDAYAPDDYVAPVEESRHG